MRLVNLLNGISKYGFRLQRYNKYLEYARISAIFGQKSPKMIQKERERNIPATRVTGMRERIEIKGEGLFVQAVSV